MLPQFFIFGWLVPSVLHFLDSCDCGKSTLAVACVFPDVSVMDGMEAEWVNLPRSLGNPQKEIEHWFEYRAANPGKYKWMKIPERKWGRV